MKYQTQDIGAPEWAQLGVMVMVKLYAQHDWEGPYPLAGYRSGGDFPFIVITEMSPPKLNYYSEAKPVEAWQPKEHEAVAIWIDGNEYISIYDYKLHTHYGKGVHVAKPIICENGLIEMRVEAYANATRLQR